MRTYFFSTIILGLVLLTMPVLAQCTYQDQPYRNEVKEVDGVQMQTYYYSNGKKRAEGPLVNGKRDGAWKIYYEDGSVQREGKYAQNALDGRWTWYDSTLRKWDYIKAETNEKGEFHGKYLRTYANGAKSAECTYKDGKLEGKYLSWHKNGIKRLECTYRSGKLEGAHVRWFDNGKIDVEGEYSNGIAVGKWKWGYEDGSYQMGSLITKSDGNWSQDGRWDEYSSDGKMTGYTTYKYIAAEGTSRQEGAYETRYPSGKVYWKGVKSWDKPAKQTEYYENGKKKKEGYWVRVDDTDVANGILTWWDEGGKKTEESEWRNGERVRVVWTPEIEAGKKWAFKSQSEFINWITRGRWIGAGSLDYTRWVMDFTNGSLSRHHVMARNMNVMESYRDNWVICEISGNKCKIIVDKSNRLHEQRFLCNSGIAIWVTRMGPSSLKYGQREYVRQ